MKKIALTIAIVLGLGLTTFADPSDGGLFQRGTSEEQTRQTTGVFSSPVLPAHGQTGNQNAPLGTGIVVLTALGAAYLVGKRHREE